MNVADTLTTVASNGSTHQTHSVSVIVTAFNEHEDLRTTVESVLRAVSEVDDLDVELIIINDGSTDGTAAVADALAHEYPLVRAIHHEVNRGWGAAFFTGVAAARHQYVTWVPGDNLISVSMIRTLLRHVGQADLLCAFPMNIECRSRGRLIISSLYSFIYRQTFDLHLRAIHTVPVYSTRLLRETPLRSRGYSLASELMVKLLRKGCTYMELPGYLNPSQNKSSALKAKNFLEVITSYLKLVYEVYVRDRATYSHAAVRVIPEELRT